MTLTMLRKNRKEREVLRKEHQGIRFPGELCVFFTFFLWSVGQA
jgi:hypothetical protein